MTLTKQWNHNAVLRCALLIALAASLFIAPELAAGELKLTGESSFDGGGLSTGQQAQQNEFLAPLWALVDLLANNVAVFLAILGLLALGITYLFSGGEMRDYVKGLTAVVLVACLMVFSAKAVAMLFPTLLTESATTATIVLSDKPPGNELLKHQYSVPTFDRN